MTKDISIGKQLTIEEYKLKMSSSATYEEHFREINMTTTPLSFEMESKGKANSFCQVLRDTIKRGNLRDCFISQRKTEVLVLPKDIASGETGTVID